MKKVREFIIHMLGGVTIEESVDSANHSHDIGRFGILHAIRKKASELYGIPAEEWCEEMYKYIDTEYRKVFLIGRSRYGVHKDIQ